jgi:RNA polymerase sigma factor (sigma-70 family)
MTDISALIERWQAGDQRAAEALYNYHRNQTFRLAYALLGNQADAEEAAQDALTYALTNIRRYDSQRASFSTWLHTITVSRCRDRLRAQRRRLPQLSLTNWLNWGERALDPAPSQEQQMVTAEVHGEVWEAVQSLSSPLREAVLLRYWAGHTFKEMAEILDCPLPTAQSRVRLAYQRLRAILSPGNLADLAGLEEERA